jgi:hypothetical protein
VGVKIAPQKTRKRSWQGRAEALNKKLNGALAMRCRRAFARFLAKLAVKNLFLSGWIYLEREGERLQLL